MAAGAGGGLPLEETPTWAVAVVCFVLVSISIVIERISELIGKWLTKRNKTTLHDALEKIKLEFMRLGLISLLLTVGQGFSEICIPKSIADTRHPCETKQKSKSTYKASINLRRLLSISSSSISGSSSTINRRVLAAEGYDKCVAKGKVPFVSVDGIHQLHIFISVLAVLHLLYCIAILGLGREKFLFDFAVDPERVRFARDTTFGTRHLLFLEPFIVSFMDKVLDFWKFIRDVSKTQIMSSHLAPQSQIKFNFQNYIKRSLEEDFKVVVGISSTIWLFALIFLLFNTHGWYSYLWLPFIPLIVILLVGTKLQVIITKMGRRIQERGEVVKGKPLVEPGDDLFWFNKPRLLLYLIHFVLFQNAFDLAFFAWSWYEFGLKSCLHENPEDIGIRITMGITIHVLCSYVTLPLYALVTQPTIFSERVGKALRKWHHTARKHMKQVGHSNRITAS
ncbi:calmodulin binding protein, putative [Ricinus communis]|uniref:MLO-like protein n=1 Tax=Ricinus communis TaxID=3988 RepID=B9S0N6_RICCO|nr:calmodulin binding protein, putative [Ricinus communis]